MAEEKFLRTAVKELNLNPQHLPAAMLSFRARCCSRVIDHLTSTARQVDAPLNSEKPLAIAFF